MPSEARSCAASCYVGDPEATDIGLSDYIQEPRQVNLLPSAAPNSCHQKNNYGKDIEHFCAEAALRPHKKAYERATLLQRIANSFDDTASYL